MNEEGEIVDPWDIDSNEAVVEQSIEYTIVGELNRTKEIPEN